MTTKEYHLLHFWFAKLSELNCQTGGYVSIGELAKYVGQSRGTAKKYLKALAKSGEAVTEKRKHQNKITYQVYHVFEGNNAE